VRAIVPDVDLLLQTKWGRAGAFLDYEDVKAFFDVWARHPDEGVAGSVSYEADISDCYFGPRVVAELLLAELDSRKKHILDVGCGTGLVGLPLIKAGHALYGVDLSREMLELAVDKEYADVYTGDVLVDTLPWKFEFDALVSVGVIGEWVPAIPLLERTIVHLAESSVIALSLATTHSDPRAIADFLDGKGFGITHLSKQLGLNHPVYEEEHYYYLVASRHGQ
jgi:predicted TPR repeat methyltransferase